MRFVGDEKVISARRVTTQWMIVMCLYRGHCATGNSYCDSRNLHIMSLFDHQMRLLTRASVFLFTFIAGENGIHLYQERFSFRFSLSVETISKRNSLKLVKNSMTVETSRKIMETKVSLNYLFSKGTKIPRWILRGIT